MQQPLKKYYKSKEDLTQYVIYGNQEIPAYFLIASTSLLKKELAHFKQCKNIEYIPYIAWLEKRIKQKEFLQL